MKMPKSFYKVVEKEPTDKTHSNHLGKWLIAIFLILLFGGFTVFQTIKVTSRIKENWNEIKFAYEKPNLVKNIRTQYETKNTKLESSLMKSEKSSEDQLVEAVVKKLDTENLK